MNATELVPIDDAEAIHRSLSRNSFFYYADPHGATARIGQYLRGLPSKRVTFGKSEEPKDEVKMSAMYARLAELSNDSYIDQLHAFIEELLGKISVGMGLNESALSAQSRARGYGSYIYQWEDWYTDAVVTNDAEKIFIPPHVDTSFITLVTSVSGLEVKSSEGEWISLPHQASCILVQVGLELERFSEHRYRALVHRATEDTSRTIFWG